MQTIGRGQAGVYRVVSELILRNHAPYFPSVDSGVDLIVDGTLRLQVKTTLRASRHWRWPEGTFIFSLKKAQTIQKQKYVPCQSRKFREFCDFLVLWAVEPSRFWIVPAVVCDGRHNVTINDRHQWKLCDIDQAKALRAQGLSYRAIAEQIGADEWTVKRRLNGSFAEPKRRYSDLMQYENRWDLITGALATLTEANTIVDRPRAVVNDAEFLKS